MTVASENGTPATYAGLRDLMVRGQLAPGSRIIEARLAERLGVSRTPVREALQCLEHEGLIEREGENGRGSKSVVAPLTERDGRELFALVGLIERAPPARPPSCRRSSDGRSWRSYGR